MKTSIAVDPHRRENPESNVTQGMSLGERVGGDQGDAGLGICEGELRLAGFVEAGIRARGYHVVSRYELDALAPAGNSNGAEFLRWLHQFATEPGWEAASRRGMAQVLFQCLGQRRLVPGIWRLQGTVLG